MKKTVLVVDDHEDLVEIVTQYLEEEGYFVVSAENGREGLAKIKEHKPHVVILDIAMPEMTGLEMLEQVRNTPELAKTSVVMLSTQGQTKNIFEAERFRVKDFLIKPFTREELIAAVHKALYE